jgi:O-antigen/teichoic acid export membrane protein
MVRQFFGLSWWFLIWRLVMQLMTASDLLILGMYGSAKLVTIYSLTKYAPETLINIVAIVVFGSTPGLGGIIGAGQLKKAARVRGEIMLLTWLVTVIVGATLLLWNRPFVDLWVGSARYAGSLPNLLILLLTIQFILIRNDANIIDLTLNLSKKVWLGGLSAAISIGLAALLVGYFNMGMLGLIIGLIAGRTVLSLAYPILIGRFLGVAPLDQVKGVLRPALVTAVLFFVTMKLDNMVPAGSFFSSSWIGLFLSVSFTAIFATLVAFFLGLTRSQQRQIFDRVRYILANVNRSNPAAR